MPRMSEVEKKKSHKRILDAASQMMRENGLEGTSVADVMKEAGLTHGGFYRHFDSKDDLVAAAYRHAVDGTLTDFETTANANNETARDRYVQTYLSQEHTDNFAKSCPLAALGADVARRGGKVAQEGVVAVQRMRDLLQVNPNEPQTYATMALLVGAVTLARLDPNASSDILQAARDAEKTIRKQPS